jgi:hypothetical protein
MTDDEWRDLTVDKKLDWLRGQVASLSARLNSISFTASDADFRTLSERIGAVETKLGQDYPED